MMPCWIGFVSRLAHLTAAATFLLSLTKWSLLSHGRARLEQAPEPSCRIANGLRRLALTHHLLRCSEQLRFSFAVSNHWRPKYFVDLLVTPPRSCRFVVLCHSSQFFPRSRPSARPRPLLSHCNIRIQFSFP